MTGNIRQKSDLVRLNKKLMSVKPATDNMIRAKCMVSRLVLSKELIAAESLQVICCCKCGELCAMVII